MPSEDLTSYFDHDLYSLLSLSDSASKASIRSAYRKTARKWHPDKNPDDPSAPEKFHLLQIANDILSDPSLKAQYDSARAAREHRRRQNDLLEGARRRMKEDLERRESGAFSLKRQRQDELGEEQLQAQKLSKLEEQGARMRRERERALREKRIREESLYSQERNNGDGTTEDYGRTTAAAAAAASDRTSTVPENDRTVKVRWAREREPAAAAIDSTQLKELFSAFGDVDHAFLRKDKRIKLHSSPRKQNVATGIVVFNSIVGAYNAIQDIRKMDEVDETYRLFESVTWFAGSEPAVLQQDELKRKSSASPPPTAVLQDAAPSTPQPASLDGRAQPALSSSTKPSFPGLSTSHSPSTPSKLGPTDGSDGLDPSLKRVPSFASFSSTPKTPSFSGFRSSTMAQNSPSLEELTMIRLKNAERKRLKEEIRRKEQRDEVER